jgi:hypothetical protein
MVLMGTQSPDFEAIPYRIRIGVTGHRKLTDPSALQVLVREAIDSEVMRLFPKESQDNIEHVKSAGRTAISFSVLSALAEGADRVVARAVLQDAGARLDAVLPMTVEDYLEDFATEESREEFGRLLARCRKPVALRVRRIRDDRSDPAAQAELRREAYAHVGHYIVDHCDVLVAIWDGEPSRGRGGTAEIVLYALEQNRPVIQVWEESFEVLNPGKNNGLDASALDAIDRFNMQEITSDQRAEYVKNLDHKHFEKPTSAAEIPARTRQLVNEHLFPYYVQSSILAKVNQDQFHRTGKYVYVCSAAAVGCAALAVLFPVIAWLGFSVELALLIVMSQSLRQARRRHSHQNWIESRFLTERIRCGVFMAICGVDPKAIEVLPYMGHSQTVNDWTVRVFDEIWGRLPTLNSCSHDLCPILNSYVRDVWIGEQIEFHKDKKDREARSRKRLARAGAVVLPTTIAAAALHLLLLAWHPGSTVPESIHLLHLAFHQGLSFIALLFPAIAASLAGMEAHREHLRLEKRSANMAPQLERLNRQMASATDPERFEDLLLQADEIMLRETQDWLMLMRYVEIKAS